MLCVSKFQQITHSRLSSIRIRVSFNISISTAFICFQRTCRYVDQKLFSRVLLEFLVEGRNTRHNHQPTTIGLSSSVAALAILVLILILKKKLKKRMKNKTPVEMGVDNPPSKGNAYVISDEANGN